MSNDRVTRIKNGVIFFKKLIQARDKWDSDSLKKWLPPFIDLVSEHINQEADIEKIFGAPAKEGVGLSSGSIGQDVTPPHAVKL